jgi:dTDP-4-dehydrorhamnose 3,5-epimerase
MSRPYACRYVVCNLWCARFKTGRPGATVIVGGLAPRPAAPALACPPQRLPILEDIEIERLETYLAGPILIRPTVHGDDRGFFAETYRRTVYAELGIPEEFVQDNHSRSSHGIVRGMHFQVGRGMAKLIRCCHGAILDAVVDLRKGSPTFGLAELFELSDKNMHQLYCPIGFAHGFCVTSDVADVMYKCSTYYDESIERGIKYDDPDVGIAWPEGMELRPSQRDATAPLLRDVEDELPFVYEA